MRRGGVSRWGCVVRWAVAVALMVFLLAPIAVVLLVSVTDQPVIALPAERLSLAHYRTLLDDSRWREAAANSLAVALLSTAVATLCGSLCAIAIWRIRSWVGDVVLVAMLLPLIMPVIIQALGFFRAFSALGLFDTLAGVTVAQSVLGLPYVVLSVSASLSAIDPKVEQAATSLGASLWQTVWRILLPLAAPGIAAGAVVCFIFAFDEVVVTLFVTGLRTLMLPRLIWDGLQDDLNPAIAAVCSALIGLTVLLFALHHAVTVLRRR